MHHEYSDDEFEAKSDESQRSASSKNLGDTFDDKSVNTNTQQLTYSTNIAGMFRLRLRPQTQKILGCRVGENVTTEYPWVFVRTSIIEDNLYLYSKSSDFMPVREQIMEYRDREVLLGYAAEAPEEGDFFNVCLTKQSRDTVMNQMESLRIEQESRVKNALYKSIGVWKDLGSGEEVDGTIIKNKRALFETEVEIRGESLDLPVNLVDRSAEEARDGYVELVVPSGQSFNNVTRRLVSRGDQANPATSDNETQTTTWTFINSWFQYSYEHQPINTKAYDEDEAWAIEKFLRNRIKVICEQIQLNATWDLYTDDYAKLVKEEKDTRVTGLVEYLEYQQYHDGSLTKEKIINDLCWHPLQTGIVIAAYTDYARAQNRVGRGHEDTMLRACEADNKVLVWSFNDCLTPKLILQGPREVTAVSIRPFDGSLVVGGCSNGQIAMWSIAEKMEKLETMAARTSTQLKSAATLRSLMTWMKETINPRVIHCTAMSSIERSQKGAITQIIWQPAYWRLDENGKIVELEGKSDEELGWQFVTSSEDGTIAFWDLRVNESTEPLKLVSKHKWKKTRRNVRKPEGFARSISPFKALDGVLSPTYMLTVKHPNDDRRVVITTMSFHVPRLRRVQVHPIPTDANDITTKRYYKPVIEKSEFQPQRAILVGTLEGDVGRVTWDGFEFTTGLRMNRDLVRWIWSNQAIHNGPVSHSVRSSYLHDVVITIGGKVFAIWREDIDQPVFLRKSSTRYTACCWDTSRPTVAILARADGTVEFWDLMVRGHEPCSTRSLSGKIITGAYTHDYHMNPQCVAFCDFNGVMRIFSAPAAEFSVFQQNHVQWMRTFVDREAKRIENLRNWQKSRQEMCSFTQKKQWKQEKAQEKLQAADIKLHEIPEEAQLKVTKKTGSRKPKFIASQVVEKWRNQWKAMELSRMQRVILEKKGIMRSEDLERRRQPVLKLRQDAHKKKLRIHDIMQQRDQIFEDTLAFLVPQRNYEGEHATMTTRTIEETEKPGQEKVQPRISSFSMKTHTDDLRSEIIREYEAVAEEARAMMATNSFRHSFNWQDILAEGQLRKSTIDIDLKKTQTDMF